MRDVFFPFFLSSDGARLSGLCSPMLEVSRPVLYGFCNFVEAESNEYTLKSLRLMDGVRERAPHDIFRDAHALKAEYNLTSIIKH